MEKPDSFFFNSRLRLHFSSPDRALDFVDQEWDQVFSANVLQHPLKMLETVWPYIQDKQIQADVPKISGSDLFHIIQKRKSCAAPGLDGRRTTELQHLTPHELQPCADFFALIQETALPLPKSLACAKQVILNKPGPSTALNKRLITILPAMLLAYTGARFAQLQKWHIRGRYMSDLYNQIRQDIDDAKCQSPDWDQIGQSQGLRQSGSPICGGFVSRLWHSERGRNSLRQNV